MPRNHRALRPALVPRSLGPVLGVVLLSAAALTGCAGGDDEKSDDATPEQVLAEAKETLDDTSGVRIDLYADELPSGVEGITAAEGIGTHAPAFEGTINVAYAGLNPEVPIIAVDDTVYAQVPFTPGWSDIDPAEYGAPDPADLMSTDAGFSSLLPATEDVKEGEQERGGADNDEILTTYTGTVPGKTVANVIPSASGDFDATYTISDEGELRKVVLTGVFYPDSDPMTYTIGFDEYGTEKDITAP